MDKMNIILEDGIQKEVSCIFYLYNSKYYLIYTEGEVDENGYVILYLVQVGKEIKNTPSGQVYTGYMVGVEISDANEWLNVQKSITEIVEDKKNGTVNKDIQYLQLSMLNSLKIVSKKQFKLMKSIVENNFKITLQNDSNLIQNTTVNDAVNSNMELNNINQIEQVQSDNYATITPVIPQVVEPVNSDLNIPETEPVVPNNESENNVIIDYKARFFEEYNKNKELEQKIAELNNKISEIKSVIEK